MKLITLNTWQGRFFRNFKPFFEEQNADIICLQELNKTDGYIPTYHSLETWNDMLDITKFKNTYYSAVWSYDLMDREVEFGNGLLSRFPITQKETLFTHGSYQKVSADNYESNVRNAQIVELDVEDQKLTVVNHHAHWEADGMGTPVSLEKIKKLVERLRSVDGPLVIVGDFNLRPESEAIQYLVNELNLRDLTAEAGLDNTLENAVTEFKVACDHIFVSKHIDVVNFERSDALLSDHKALIVEFDISNS